MKKLTPSALTLTLLLSTTLMMNTVVNAANTSGSASKEVYTWKTGSSTAYSDTPRNLQLDKNSSTMNIRTQSSKPVDGALKAPESLADKQAALNKELADQNKKIEEQNKKVEEEQKKAKAENCKAARDNRQRAENAQRNKEELVKRFDTDIAKYCN